MQIKTYYNGQNLKDCQRQMLAWMWDNWNCHTLLLGMENGTAALENSLAICYKVKYTLIIKPSNLLSDIYIREMKAYAH